jgi:hypothetical protein
MLIRHFTNVIDISRQQNKIKLNIIVICLYNNINYMLPVVRLAILLSFRACREMTRLFFENYEAYL